MKSALVILVLKASSWIFLWGLGNTHEIFLPFKLSDTVRCLNHQIHFCIARVVGSCSCKAFEMGLPPKKIVIGQRLTLSYVQFYQLHTMRETQVRLPVGKIPWRQAWRPTPVFLPRKIPWTEEPGGLESLGSQRDGLCWTPNTFTLFSARKKEKVCGQQARCPDAYLLLAGFQHLGQWTAPNIASSYHPGGPSLRCSVGSCWRPQLGQAPPSNAAEIAPAGLRAGWEWATPHSVSLFQAMRALWGFPEELGSSWLHWNHTHPYTFNNFPLIQTACTARLCLWRFSDQYSCSVVPDSLWPYGLPTPGLPAQHHLLDFTQTHVHRVSDAIQPSHPLSSPSPPALNLSQHQGLFQWVSSLHQVAKALEFQLQHQSFQWIFRTDFL